MSFFPPEQHCLWGLSVQGQPDSTNIHSVAVKHHCLVGSRYLFEAQMLVSASAFFLEGSGSDLPLHHSRRGRCDHTGSPDIGEHRNLVLLDASVTQGHSSCSTPAHPDKMSLLGVCHRGALHVFNHCHSFRLSTFSPV